MKKEGEQTKSDGPIMGFWADLKKPFFVLAPMADVTDCAFRQMIAKYSRHGEEGGGPDVFWTEFVSADGLCSPGREALLRDLEFSDREHPIVAQIFGSHPEHMRQTAALIKELGFDGIDINMGCPDKSIEKQGAGAAHIKDPKLAQEIIRAVMEGAAGLPVSVKTRVGYNTEDLEGWLGAILETKPAVITVHARTRKELSLVPARWELVKRAKELAKGTGTLIIGNGDVQDLADAQAKADASGADGVMIGRGVFGTPWLFDRARTAPPSLAEKFEIMVEHTHLYEKLLGDIKNFAIMKKHYKAYVNGFDGAKELRVHLMEAKNADEVERIAREFLRSATVSDTL
ncbi:MAG TPA: tRNA-dihydrouridine synthase [Candidatus Yonathbacteria bacterium]|nr:tRNA-dihydrouridine synthase [Candidatus Yonathbacteria bacterium]